MLATENFNQLRAVFAEYEKISGHSIEKAVSSEFSGDNELGFMAIVKCVRNRDAYFAELLMKSMKVVSWLLLLLSSVFYLNNQLTFFLACLTDYIPALYFLIYFIFKYLCICIGIGNT